MSFRKQIIEAIRCQIEDFFHVRWQAVALMLVFIASLIDDVYVRTHYQWGIFPPFWGVHLLITIVGFFALINVGRFLK